MTTRPRLSDRLAGMVNALPLRPGLRVLEIGGAPGTAAKAVAQRIGDGHILVIDRSAVGVARTEQNAAAEIAAGLLSVRNVAAGSGARTVTAGSRWIASRPHPAPGAKPRGTRHPASLR